MTTTTANPAEVAAARLAPVVADVVAIRRQIAALQAREARALATAGAIADDWADASTTRSDAELAHRAVAAEVAAALRVSDRTVQRQIAEAQRLVAFFPETTASLEAGRISAAHARVIVDSADRIERPELLAEYEASVLTYAEAESASRLRPVAKRRAEWFRDETIRERHAAVARTRAVRLIDLDDGMAELHIHGPAVVIHGIHDRLTRMARDVSDADAQAVRDARGRVRDASARRRATAQAGGHGPDLAGAGMPEVTAAVSGTTRAAGVAGTASATGASEAAGASGASGASGDEFALAQAELDELLGARRSLDAIRADLAADLLLASDPVAHVGTSATGLGGIRATVQITVPVLTLLDSPVDDPFDAVTLAGHGPIDPATARELTRGSPGWDRILTHPVSGAVLAVDRYQPSSEMRRALVVRDLHCRFPGCRQSAARSDRDHTIDWAAGGTTALSNLAHLCRRHHTLKHHTPWSVVQHPGGVLEWTSPTGARYPDHPASGVHFCTDEEFDPAPF